MTAPAGPLSDEQERQVQVMVGPAAWTAHLLLPMGQQVEPAEALALLGDLRLVAAEVLEAVALSQGGVAATAESVAGFKVGPIEIKSGAGAGGAAAVNAASWLSRAARLRREARLGQRAVSTAVGVEVAF